VPDSKPMQYRIIDRSQGNRAGEREAVVHDLLAKPARIAPR